MRFFLPLLLVAPYVISCDPGSSDGRGSGGAAPATTGGATSGGSTARGGSNAMSGGVGSGGVSGAASGGVSGAASGGASGAASGGASAGTSGAASGGASGSAGMGGGGASAGTAGAAGNAGAAGSGGAGSGCANTLFCEDFESYATGTAAKTDRWEPVSNMGTLTIDTMHARGQKALHLNTQGNGKAYISLTSFAPPNNSFFGRMYAWVDAFPTAPNYAHFTMVEATGTTAGAIRPIGGQYIADSKGSFWGVGSDSGPTGDWTNWKTSAPTTAGKWVCIEWELASANDEIRVWLDGEAKPDLSVSKTNHGGTAVDFVFPTFNAIWFGWWLYHANPTPDHFDIWLDDIAIGSQRLGC